MDKNADKKPGIMRKSFNFAVGMPVRQTLRVAFMAVAGVITLATLGMPLPSLTELWAAKSSILSLGAVLTPTLTKGAGLIVPHGGYVAAMSFVGGWLMSGTAINAYKAMRDGNLTGRDGFIHNTGKTVLRVATGFPGLLAGTFAGTALASLFSKAAADAFKPWDIVNRLRKTEGIFTPTVTPNITVESVSNAAVDTMQQGWSVFWQGIGSGITPDLGAALLVAATAYKGTKLAMRPRP